MDVTIQVRQRGVLTLPAELREQYNIQEGDTFSLVDLDGIFVLTPMMPILPELVARDKTCRLETGMGLNEFIKRLA
jgi:AbrB family looped-hinge helix DNA binding protein